MATDALEFAGMTVIESRWLTEAGDPVAGWFPCGGGWNVKRMVIPQIPYRGAVKLNASTLVMHPDVLAEVKRTFGAQKESL